MVVGIIIDFLLIFIICVVIYKSIYITERPNIKNIIIAVCLGVLAIVLAIVLGNLFNLFINETIDILLIRLADSVPLLTFGIVVCCEILSFVVIEEIAKYFLFKILWNNGKLQMKSPLQTALIFIIVGATFAFIEDVFYILDGTEAYKRILITVAGHMTFALVYAYFFSKEVVRSEAVYKMDKYLSIVKKPQLYSNVFLVKEKHLTKGFWVSVAIHFGHNFLAFATYSLGILGDIIIYIEVIVLTIYFIKKLRKMFVEDVPYSTLANERIFTHYPSLLPDLQNALNELK